MEADETLRKEAEYNLITLTFFKTETLYKFSRDTVHPSPRAELITFLIFFLLDIELPSQPQILNRTTDSTTAW